MRFLSLAVVGSRVRTGVVLALPFLTGCAITLNVPVNRFESPESSGSGQIFLEGGIQGASKAIIVSNTTASPPDVNSPAFERTSAGTVGVGVGILERVDLSVRGQVNTPSLLKAKLQLLGSSSSRAARGTFSLAVSAGIGMGNKSQQDADVFTPVTAVSDVDFITYDAAVIAGYRLSPSVLLYGSGYRTRISVDGKVTQISPSTIARFNGSAIQDGATLGLEMRTAYMSVMLEMGYGSARYQSASDDGVFFGALVRINGRRNN